MRANSNALTCTVQAVEGLGLPLVGSGILSCNKPTGDRLARRLSSGCGLGKELMLAVGCSYGYTAWFWKLWFPNHWTARSSMMGTD